MIKQLHNFIIQYIHLSAFFLKNLTNSGGPFMLGLLLFLCSYRVFYSQIDHNLYSIDGYFGCYQSFTVNNTVFINLVHRSFEHAQMHLQDKFLDE